MVKDTIFSKKKSLRFREKIYYLEKPIVMGIINITPDSFYNNSRIHNIESCLKTIQNMLESGATIIDIGAASSRPNADIIAADEELKRLTPYLEVITKAFPNVWFSIDTYNAHTATVCVENYGFFMINDISAYSLDTEMLETIKRLNVPYVLMHMKGNPQNMIQQAIYNDVVAEVFQFLGEKIHELQTYGINDIIVDPGFGFGKNIEHNYTLLRNLEVFKALERPIMVGISRKSMIYKLLNITPNEALHGSLLLQGLAIINGADIIRTHDVKETVQTLQLIEKYLHA
ncbi:MAG: dihydropteroate synthase [Bacteroidales bacterium]|nr:dihydropteroate synthase [Bacteroidales bacterium]